MNSSRIWLERELKSFAASLPRHSRVLDAGAGDQIYRPLFKDCEYESADFEQVDKPYAKSTYVCDLCAIPVADARYDAVVFSQVMEHLPEPSLVLDELRRVLTPGGLLFCSAPLFYEEHELPFDYYRYTQFGMRHLLEKSGFEVVELRWLEGYLGTVTHQLKSMARHLPVSPSELGGGLTGWVLAPVIIVVRPLFKLLAVFTKLADVRHRHTAGGLPKNHVAISKKRSL